MMKIILFWLPLIELIFLFILMYYKNIPYMEIVLKSMGAFLYFIPFIFIGTLLIGFFTYLLGYFSNYWKSPYPYVMILIIVYLFLSSS